MRHGAESTLSLGQERSWFIDQYAGAAVNTLAHRVRLCGELRTDALGAALTDVIGASDVLRWAIRSHEGQASRVPAQPLPAAVPTTDLSTLPATEREDAVLRAVERAAGNPFDLGQGPLLRAELLRVDVDDHVLLLTTHRAVVDDASLSLLVNRLGRAYRARLHRAEPLPSDAGAFEVFVARERAGAQQGRSVAGAAWRDYLADVVTLELPTDRVRGLQPQYTAATVETILSPALDDAVRAVADRLTVPAGEVLRAAFQALLHRYSGQPVVALGVPAGRRDSATADLVGPLATWLVLRSELHPDTTLTGLIMPAGGADRPPVLPFETLIEEVQPPRDPARSAIVQATFTAREAATPADFGAATVVDQRTVPATATLHDVSVLAQPGPAGTRIGLTYRADLFDRATAGRLLGHYVSLLDAAVARPDEPVARLPYLSVTERTRILDEFNRTEAPFPRDATVHELFEEQVLRNSDARAVTIEGQHLTYRELNERANKLAHRLRSCGVGRGTYVALCLERSLELMVAVMAVLKSGGAYIPLDPAYPTDRLAFMLADTQARFLVTQRRLREMAPIDDAATVIVLDDPADAAVVADQSAVNPVNVNAAEDLTYIVYTSGSTGRPKGVETVHFGVVRLVVNTDILELDERTSYLQISPLSFDACTLEIFGPLLNGGRVVLLPPGVPTPARVAHTVREQGVDTLWLVAPLANLTIDTHLDDLRGLRQFMAGGDVLSIPHIRQVLDKLPHIKLINGYGPTEVTAFSVSHKIDYIDPDWPSIPIGRPMHNTTAYILDPLGQPVPIGVWGEMYLGGPGVALGYHNRPDLNAERFLPDNFRPGPGAQLYRTGDRCRWLPDGTIQFHGRLDTQVKIDGLRVELGEIQSVVAGHGSVAAAVVTAPVIGTRRTLVAYVVPADPDGFDASVLRAHLTGVLPSVMVPAHFVTMSTIPLTPNNKVDFQALPEPQFGTVRGHRPPETSTQQALAEIWREILGVPAVGLDDNFFELGGHSLRAVPMIAAISMRFGIDLAVQDIFEAPGLEALASRVEERMLAAIPAEELERMFSELGN